MNIREATPADWNGLWQIIEPTIRSGTTYAYPRDMPESDARIAWLETPLRTFVAEDETGIKAVYYLRTNYPGPGSHVCNCGYIVAADARGQGLAGALCEHSQRIARQLGYRAMQFNFVAASNSGAVRLWQKLGFKVVGTLPGAFNHPEQGYVDALVMFKDL